MHYFFLFLLVFNVINTSFLPSVNIEKKHYVVGGAICFVALIGLCFYLYKTKYKTKANEKPTPEPITNKLKIDGLSDRQNLALNDIKNTLCNFKGSDLDYVTLVLEIKELNVLKIFLKQHGENKTLKDAVDLVSDLLLKKLNNQQFENLIFTAFSESNKNNDETGRAVLELLVNIYPDLFYLYQNKTTLLHKICLYIPLPDSVSKNFVPGFLEKLKNYKGDEFFSLLNQYNKTPFFNLIVNEDISESTIEWLILNNVNPYIQEKERSLLEQIFQYNYKEGNLKKLRLLNILTGLPKYDEIPYDRPDDSESDNIKKIKNKIETKINSLKDEQKEMLGKVGKFIGGILKNTTALLNDPKNNLYQQKNKALYRYAYWTYTATKISANIKPNYSTYNLNAFQGKTYVEN